MKVTSDAHAETGAAFAEAVSIMHRLRAPGGCPWDREQTFATVETCTLEEVYEVFDAISREDWENLREELGDLLLQVLFYSEMAEEDGRFTIAEVVRGLSRKLVRRHPHVFANRDSLTEDERRMSAGFPVEGIDSAQVVRNWERIKQAEQSKSGRAGSGEGKPEGQSRLDRIPRALPALAEARKLGSSAHKVGFDWPEVGGIFEKIHEEIGELREAIARQGSEGDQPTRGDATRGDSSREGHTVADEVGDLLFTAANLARRLNVDPERSLRDANTRFRRRFAHMEAAAHPSGNTGSKGLEGLAPEELESLWQQAKAAFSGEQVDRQTER